MIWHLIGDFVMFVHFYALSGLPGLSLALCASIILSVTVDSEFYFECYKEFPLLEKASTISIIYLSICCFLSFIHKF